MRMTNEELENRIEKRLDVIEKKLDKHLELVSLNKADISWVKGYVKISITTIFSLVAGMIATVIKVFYK